MFSIVFWQLLFLFFSHFSFQLNTEWTQIEVIDLINDGTGLGFGIIGGRSTGVVVKTILPGGVADAVCIPQQFIPLNCLNIGTPKIIHFPFGTNGKLMVSGVQYFGILGYTVIGSFSIVIMMLYFFQCFLSRIYF